MGTGGEEWSQEKGKSGKRSGRGTGGKSGGGRGRSSGHRRAGGVGQKKRSEKWRKEDEGGVGEGEDGRVEEEAGGVGTGWEEGRRQSSEEWGMERQAAFL